MPVEQLGISNESSVKSEATARKPAGELNRAHIGCFIFRRHWQSVTSRILQSSGTAVTLLCNVLL